MGKAQIRPQIKLAGTPGQNEENEDGFKLPLRHSVLSSKLEGRLVANATWLTSPEMRKKGRLLDIFISTRAGVKSQTFP